MALWRWRFIGSLFVGLGALGIETAGAQQVGQTTPWQLPRPGYEPHLLHVGPLTMGPQLQVNETYDSNVFASGRNVEDDFVTTVAPSVTIQTDHRNFHLDSRIWANQAVYAQHPKEDNATLGANVQTTYDINSRNQLSVGLSGAHLSESRADPESTRGRDQSPASYNVGAAAFGYSYQHNRVKLGATSNIERVDYVNSGQQDRDRFEYRGALRGSYVVTPRFDAFLETYLERRDFDTARDRDGLDRDSLTTGFYAGTTVDLASKWWGEIGVGLFHVENDDPALKSFIGIGARGAVTWSITPRTALTASIRREDAATVEIGASGRIETQFGLKLEQEARRNLLTKIELGVLQDDYREKNRDLITPTAQFSVEYLVNRRLSLTGAVGYANRIADQVTDHYDRYYVTIGVRWQF